MKLEPFLRFVGSVRTRMARKSELIVPCNSAHQNPQAIAEVARILKLDAKNN